MGILSSVEASQHLLLAGATKKSYFFLHLVNWNEILLQNYKIKGDVSSNYTYEFKVNYFASVEGIS